MPNADKNQEHLGYRNFSQIKCLVSSTIATRGERLICDIVYCYFNCLLVCQCRTEGWGNLRDRKRSHKPGQMAGETKALALPDFKHPHKIYIVVSTLSLSKHCRDRDKKQDCWDLLVSQSCQHREELPVQ